MRFIRLQNRELRRAPARSIATDVVATSSKRALSSTNAVTVAIFGCLRKGLDDRRATFRCAVVCLIATIWITCRLRQKPDDHGLSPGTVRRHVFFLTDRGKRQYVVVLDPFRNARGEEPTDQDMSEPVHLGQRSPIKRAGSSVM
jgi:hypothetical protein